MKKMFQRFIKPLLQSMLTYYQLDSIEQNSVKQESRYIFLFHENAFENIVCITSGSFQDFMC